jgi:hypothetical protein
MSTTASRLLQMFGARLRPDLRAILHHLLQGDQPFLAQRHQHLREQFIEFLLLLDTEIRMRVEVHFLPIPSATGTPDRTHSDGPLLVLNQSPGYRRRSIN